jgi:hypothetical protein
MYYNFLFTLISVFVMSDPIFPCSCDDEMSVAEAVNDAMVVIDARVLLKTEDNRMEYQIFVNQSFKGGFQWKDTLHIYSMPTDATCGIPFDDGERYIIYAYPVFDRFDKKQIIGYETSICTRTRKFNYEEIEAIKMLQSD